MITKEKLEELRQRMINHEVENDVAVVKLTAKEMSDLLEAVETYHTILELFIEMIIDRAAEIRFWWNR